jgi:hypothetical protein
LLTRLGTKTHGAFLDGAIHVFRAPEAETTTSGRPIVAVEFAHQREPVDIAQMKVKQHEVETMFLCQAVPAPHPGADGRTDTRFSNPGPPSKEHRGSAMVVDQQDASLLPTAEVQPWLHKNQRMLIGLSGAGSTLRSTPPKNGGLDVLFAK